MRKEINILKEETPTMGVTQTNSLDVKTKGDSMSTPTALPPLNSNIDTSNIVELMFDEKTAKKLSKNTVLFINHNDRRSICKLIRSNDESMVGVTEDMIDSLPKMMPYVKAPLLSDDLIEVSENKTMKSWDAKRTGDATFELLSQLFGSKKLDNESNREEELDSVKSYTGKFHHLIRFVAGVSEKSQLLITILRDSSNDAGLVRDNGTMSALCFGEYFGKEIITAQAIIDIVNDVVEVYGIESYDCEAFITPLLNYLNGLTDEQRGAPISLKSILDTNEDIKDTFNGCKLQYTLNLLSTRQHHLDMKNANLQSNPWVSYDYYMNPLKTLDQYKETFLGKKLTKYVENQPGLATFKKTKLLSGHTKKAEDKKVYVMMPLIISYAISRFCTDEAELAEAYSMLWSFESHETDLVDVYWSGMFSRVVKEATYQDMVDFYENDFTNFYTKSKWDDVYTTVKDLIGRTGQTTAGLTPLHVTKFDTGLWFLSLAIWVYRNKSIGVDKVVNSIVNTYTNKLKGSLIVDVDGVQTTLPVYKVFGGFAGSGFTNGTARAKYLFVPTMKDVLNNIKAKKDDRRDEEKLRDKSLTKHSMILRDEELPTKLLLFPLSSNEDPVTINLGTGGGLHWLHPNDDENKATDGFLGFIDDNLKDEWKTLDWKKFGVNCQSDYWNKITVHNYNCLDNYNPENDMLKRKVKNSLDSVQTLASLDCGVSL